MADSTAPEPSATEPVGEGGSDGAVPPPVICTLDPTQRTRQKLAWTDVSALAVHSERLANGVSATFGVEVEPQLRELAEREQDCCGTWLSVEVRPARNDTAGNEPGDHGVDHLVLEVTTDNPDGVALIHSMMATPRTEPQS